MFKKLTKILLILLTVFTVYFIKIKDVEAAKCAYYSPFTYIKSDSNGSYAVIVKADVKAVGTDLWDELSHSMVNVVTLGHFNNAELKANNGYHGIIDGFTFSIKGDDVNYGYYSITDGHLTEKDSIRVVPIAKYGNCEYDYLSLTIDNKKDSYAFLPSTEADYISYLKNQYSKVSRDGKQMYKFYSTGNMENADDENSSINIKLKNYYKKVGFFDVENNPVVTVVFKKITANTTYYPDDNMKSFEKNIDYAMICSEGSNCDNNENYRLLTEEEKKLAKDGLCEIVDCKSTDDITNGSHIYDVTINKMKNYLTGVKNQSDTITAQEKIVFQRWFSETSRYLFESDIVEFRNIFEFLYRKGIVKFSNNDDNTAIGNQNQNQYELLQAVFDAMVGIKYVSNIQDTIASDRCLPLCESCINYSQLLYDCKNTCNRSNPSDAAAEKKCIADKCTKFSESNSKYDSNACIQCQKSTSYKSCRNCLYNEENKTRCENAYKNVYNSSKSFDQAGKARESCIKTCMGEDVYSQYNTSYDKVTNELKSYKDDFISQMADNLIKYEKYTLSLSRVTDPTLDIDFNEDGYVINCEDVKVLHIIYKFMVYLAPALVILLGSLDYAKAVINSDEKKQQEFKKHFKKRVILLVLLILVPIIISMILEFYNDATDSSLENNLMYCVVKGSE